MVPCHCGRNRTYNERLVTFSFAFKLRNFDLSKEIVTGCLVDTCIAWGFGPFHAMLVSRGLSVLLISRGAAKA